MELQFYKDRESMYAPFIVDQWFSVDYYDDYLESNQPQNVCHDCNHEFGYWTCIGPGLSKAPVSLMKQNKDWHYGECEVCGKETNLTNPKYYGYLYKGWRNKKK